MPANLYNLVKWLIIIIIIIITHLFLIIIIIIIIITHLFLFWCHFTFTNVCLDLFSHLLKRVGSAKLNSVKLHNHLKPLCVKRKQCVCHSRPTTLMMFTKQCQISHLLPLHLSKAFNDKTEIETSVNAHQLSSRAALKAAKQKQLPRSLLSSQK